MDHAALEVPRSPGAKVPPEIPTFDDEMTLKRAHGSK